MKKTIIAIAIAMVAATTSVNAEVRNHKVYGRGGRQNTTVVVNNGSRRGGSTVTVINNGDHRHNGNTVTVINDNTPPRHMKVGMRVDRLPKNAVRVHRNGCDYYQVDNALYRKVATATGIIYTVAELLNW